MCNYCALKNYKKTLPSGLRVVKKQSSFMGGVVIFKIKDGEKIRDYIEPCKEYPNGCKWYESHFVFWFKEISKHCCC